MKKKTLELYFEIKVKRGLNRDTAAGLLNMHGYPETESKKGALIGRFPFRFKDGEFALSHALIIKRIAADMGCAAVVGVRVK